VDAVTGIDTHRDTHEVEIADAAGRPIATMQTGNDSAGFTRLLAAIAEVVPGPRVELPRVFRTGKLRLIHAASCPFRYSSKTSCGVRYPSVEWRRVLL